MTCIAVLPILCHGSVILPGRDSGCRRSFLAGLLLPLYPQYASATTASACDAVFAELDNGLRRAA